jgi:hypothetical protein
MPPQRKSTPRGPEYAALGEAIELLIAKHPDMSQESVAEVSGLNIKQVGAMVRGQSNPTYRNLLRLCVGLRVELDELMAFARELRDPHQWSDDMGPRLLCGDRINDPCDPPMPPSSLYAINARDSS